MKIKKDKTSYCELFLRWILLIALAILLASCNTPQKTSPSGNNGAPSANTGPAAQIMVTPTVPPGTAVFNYERNIIHDDPNGSNIQKEVATIPLVFSYSTEGPLIVEGSGKINWTDVAKYPVCGFKASADGTMQVSGLFYSESCTFSLRLTYKYSQPTTYDQSPDCNYPLHFDQTEFSTSIHLDTSHAYSNEVKQMNYWDMTTARITNLKSSPIELCFAPEVINRSTPTP